MEENITKKSGFVSIVGRPNVGKSTLMNLIAGQKIAITSKKPQTTRNRIRGIYTEERGQIVFVDTPGIISPKNKLGEYMLSSAQRTVNDVDLIFYIIEPSEYIGKTERHIIDVVSDADVPVFLLINKIDKIPNDKILTIIDAFKNEADFAEIIPISALKKKNIDDLMDSAFKYLPEGPFLFDGDMVTDQPERAICAELIREKALRVLEEEVPHGIAVAIDSMKKRKSRPIMDIEATIVCEKDSHKGIIIGKRGSMLKKIGTLAREDMEDMIGMKVNLKLFVKVKKDWRDSDFLVKNFGYDKKEL